MNKPRSYKVSEFLRTPLLGTWVHKGRETLLNRRFCPAEAAHGTAQTRSLSGLARIVGVLGTGSSWRNLPEEEFGTWLTVYGRYRRGQEEDLWQRIMDALRHRR